MPQRLVTEPRRVKTPARLAAAAVAGLVGAPAAAQLPDSRNAATWYEKSFERLEAIEITEQEWEALDAFRHDPDGAPPETVREVIARVQTVLSAVRRGVRQGYSDFGLDYSQGFDLMLPHLGRLRTIGKLMTVEAGLHLRDGNAAAAADGIASLYRMGEHVSDDAIIISSLVGQSIFWNADGVAQYGLDRGTFGPAEATELRKALEGLEGRDPFEIVDAIDNEREVMVGWVRDKYGDEEDRARMLDELSFDGNENEEAALRLLDPAEFDAELEQVDALMQRVVEIFSSDDPDFVRDEMHKITEELQAGEHGSLAMVTVPAYGKLYDRMIEAEERIAERKEMLDVIVAGEIPPGDLANAAVWYLQAIEMLRKIDPDDLARLRKVIGSPLDPMDESTQELLAQSAPIIDTLRQAAHTARCDFSIARGRNRLVIPSYLGGMREAARLLDADAVRLLQKGDGGQAADRLAIVYRMAAHLAGDGWLTCSLVAHAAYTASVPLVELGLRWELLATEQRDALSEAVRAMGRTDPFGYVAAIRGGREQVVRGLHLGGEARQRAEAVVERLDGDQVLYLLAILEDRTPDDDPDELSGLDDVISHAGLVLARTQAGRVRGLIRESENLQVVYEQEIPDIGSVRDRMTAARADLRRAYFAVNPE